MTKRFILLHIHYVNLARETQAEINQVAWSNFSKQRIEVPGNDGKAWNRGSSQGWRSFQVLCFTFLSCFHSLSFLSEKQHTILELHTELHGGQGYIHIITPSHWRQRKGSKMLRDKSQKSKVRMVGNAHEHISGECSLFLYGASLPPVFHNHHRCPTQK